MLCNRRELRGQEVDQKLQVDIAERLFALKDNKQTDLADTVYKQPALDYFSQEVSEREEALFFRQYPLLICLSCEMPKPGDYHCDDFSGVPIIVVRRKEGSVAAYLNVCRHRGARLACDNGSGLRQLRCPYHSWRYAADSGNLVSIPFDEGFAELDKIEFGLHQLPVVEHGGLIFVKPTQGDSIDPSGFLAGFESDLISYEIENYHHFETRVLEAKVNWKLVIDTFLETYHLNSLHRETVAPILHNNLSVFTAQGNHLRMVAARKTLDELKDIPEHKWDLIQHSAIIYVLFPNTVFIMQGDHLETWRVYPGESPNESRMHVSLYTPEASTTESASQYWSKNMDLLMATVLQEDFPLATNIQKDFPSRGGDMVFGRNEPALQHFHRRLKAKLGS